MGFWYRLNQSIPATNIANVNDCTIQTKTPNANGKEHK